MTRGRASSGAPDRLVSCTPPPQGPLILRAALSSISEAYTIPLCRCFEGVNVSRAYRQTGKLVEKYDVITPERPGGGGEYPLQDGFGWTNGVLRKLMALYPKDVGYLDTSQCPKEPY